MLLLLQSATLFVLFTVPVSAKLLLQQSPDLPSLNAVERFTYRYHLS